MITSKVSKCHPAAVLYPTHYYYVLGFDKQARGIQGAD